MLLAHLFEKEFTTMQATLTTKNTTPTNGHVQPKSKLVTLQETQRAMQGLIQPGTRNGKLAFWNASLSKRNSLERNGMQAQVMRQYVNKPLPEDRNVLKAQLYPIMDSSLNTLYAIEELWNAGIIHLDAGMTFESQSAWREKMCSLIPGMGEKTISFALHIYDVENCQLLTIDCWHAKRLNETRDLKTPVYLECEQRLYEDIYSVANENDWYYSPCVIAAWLWENTRRTYKKLPDGYSSHAGISCYC